jgi:putative addiction module killer protein
MPLDTAYPIGYDKDMVDVRETEEFSCWLRDLEDRRLKGKILVRIDRLRFGNQGDVAPVGRGVSELRIHYGSGWRVYFTWRGSELVILLCGGAKSTQQKDIDRAQRLKEML